MPSPKFTRRIAVLMMVAGSALSAIGNPVLADSFAADAPTADSGLRARLDALEKRLSAPPMAAARTDAAPAVSSTLSPAQQVEVERRLESAFIRLGTVNGQDLVRVQGDPPSFMSKDEIEKKKAELRARIEQEVIAGMSTLAHTKPVAAALQAPAVLTLPQPPANSLAPAPLPAKSPVANKANAK